MPTLLEQDLSILVSSLAVVAAARSMAGGAPLAASPLFGLLVALAMSEKLTSICSELAIERDWVTQLAGARRQVLRVQHTHGYV